MLSNDYIKPEYSRTQDEPRHENFMSTLTYDHHLNNLCKAHLPNSVTYQDQSETKTLE